MLWSKVTYCTEKCWTEKQSLTSELGLPGECHWKQRIIGRLSTNRSVLPVDPGVTSVLLPSLDAQGCLETGARFTSQVKMKDCYVSTAYLKFYMIDEYWIFQRHCSYHTENFKGHVPRVRFDMRIPVSRLLPPSQTTDLSSCQTQCGVCFWTRPDVCLT